MTEEKNFNVWKLEPMMFLLLHELGKIWTLVKLKTHPNQLNSGASSGSADLDVIV